MNQLTEIIKRDASDVAGKIDFKELDNKTILITGASGLLGTYFLATLQEFRSKGIAVKIVASGKTPFPKELHDLVKNVKFISGDLTNPEIISSLPKADYIIHAAGYGQPGKFMENPAKTIALNTTCTIELFKKLKPGGKFLFVSSSEVYSGLPKPPYKETEIGTTNTDHPRSCYIEGKRCGEAVVNTYRAVGVLGKSARLSLAYGPGTKSGDARVLNSFIYRGIVEKKISLADHGEAKRTYCYVTDAVEIMWHILFDGTDAIYNVGGNSKTTIGKLAKKIGSYLHVPVEFPKTEAGAQKGAPADVSLDMSKAKKQFAKTKYVSLDEGLGKTIEWQKALYLNTK